MCTSCSTMQQTSKPLAASSSKLQSTASLFGSLKTSSALKPATNKRQILSTQMREKAFGRLGEAATTASVAPSQAFPSQLEQAKNPIAAVASQLKSSTPPPAAKKERSPVLSPLDTYEMSDHGGSSDTDEEEERARRVGKRIPTWAQRENLRQLL